MGISFPCLEIVPVGLDSKPLLNKASSADLLIFISVNAVIEAHRTNNLPPEGFRGEVLAIGNATANKLDELGLPVTALPEPPFNSESLVELITQKMHNLQNVAIVKGVGGRELLEKSLKQIGKNVEIINVYRRKAPSVSRDEINSVFLNYAPDIVTITSNETLQNLVSMAGDRFADHLMNLPLVVNSQRNADLAQVLGFQSHVLIAEEPGDQGQINAINYWNRSYRFKL